MDISLIFLPLFIILLVLTDFKNPINGWGSLVLLLVSLGGLYSAADRFILGIAGKLVDPDLILWLNYILVIIFVKIPLCLFPVTVLMFAVHYSHWNVNRTRPIKPGNILIFLIPAVATFFVPLNPKEYFATISDNRQSVDFPLFSNGLSSNS
jgi:hypothetical protein